MVCHIPSYYNPITGAMDFCAKLTELVEEFSKETGIDKKDVCWENCSDSDWCYGKIILYCEVPKEWNPTKDTFVIGDSYDPKWSGHTAKDFWSYIKGRGCCVNIEKYPPQNPHSLYRTKKMQF